MNEEWHFIESFKDREKLKLVLVSSHILQVRIPMEITFISRLNALDYTKLKG